MMELSVEFTGLARVLSKVSSQTLDVDDETTYQHILRMLGERHPELIGDVIAPDFSGLQHSNMMNLNGAHMIQPSQMDQSPSDGDMIILMSILAGG